MARIRFNTPSVSIASAGLPAWVPSPGQWANVGLNTLNSVKGPDAASSPGAFANILNAWCGVVHAPLYGGVYGSLIVGPGGGHGSWDGSDVYAYDIETRQCSLLKATYNPTTNNTYSTGAYPDGSPLPPHNYAGYVVMPNKGVKGSLWVPWTYIENDAGPAAGVVNDCFFLDLNTLVWSRGPSTSPGRYHGAAIAADGSVWWRAGAGVQPLKRLSADGTTVTTYSSSTSNTTVYTAAAIDPTRNRFFFWEGSLVRLWVTDISNPNVSPTQYTFGSGPGGNSSLGYSTVLDRIIGWGGGKTVYTLDPANPGGGWTAQGSGSTLTPPALESGQDSVYTKLRWVESVKCLIGIISTSTVAWAYRPVGT